jgi:hypothetical protein
MSSAILVERFMSPEAKRKMIFEKVLATLKRATDGVLEDYAEVESVAVVVTWKGGLRELPIGFLMGPAGPLSEAELARTIEQLARMLGFATAQAEKLAITRVQHHAQQGNPTNGDQGPKTDTQGNREDE